MSDNKSDELDPFERRLLTSLTREMPSTAAQTESTVRMLRAEGFFRTKSHVGFAVRWLAAAALLLIVAAGSGFIGHRIGRGSSLESMIARRDLTMTDRILLLQRAGSAYVQAAHAYADATTVADSTAIEVAQQVLRGAAHALVRNELDGGVATRLTTMLQPPHSQPAAKPTVLWF